MSDWKLEMVMKDDGKTTVKFDGKWNGRILVGALKAIKRAYRHQIYIVVKPKAVGGEK